MTDRETLDLYEATGALLHGHFRLTSGLHSDVYLQSALVLQHPVHAAALGEALAAPFRGDRVGTVLAPAIGGIVVSHEVARALGARALYLGDTVYRIHGTNQPKTIGHAVSSGCFRLVNRDVIDLFARVPVGTKVVVRQAPAV